MTEKLNHKMEIQRNQASWQNKLWNGNQPPAAYQEVTDVDSATSWWFDLYSQNISYWMDSKFFIFSWLAAWLSIVSAPCFIDYMEYYVNNTRHMELAGAGRSHQKLGVHPVCGKTTKIRMVRKIYFYFVKIHLEQCKRWPRLISSFLF